MTKIDLVGKRALVTGGSSGIGEAVAAELAQAGADVAINYVSHGEAAEAGAGRVREMGRRALALEADVADAAAVKKMFAAIDAEWGGIDILINNAGIDGPRAVSWESEIDAWRKVLDVNLFGAFYCAREALKRMVAQKGGVVLNMTSVHEIVAWGGYSAYATSKAGLSMLTKTLAQEAAPFGVRVLALAPGAIKTPVNAAVWQDAAGLADLNAKIAMGRMGERGEIAGMAVMLVSGVASYVTGTTVMVDGGLTDYPDFAHGG